ncbi:MAG: hypothetical protein MUF72_10085 [Elainella sp. Prado103]|nr:hypothetical protein [Elainella sp. Prado103]
MTRRLPDLNLPSEWQLISTATLIGQPSGLRYWQIEQQNFTVNSHVALVGVSSEYALSRWFVGAYASMLVPSPVSGSSTLVSIDAWRKVCSLGRYTLIDFPKIINPPITLNLRFPKWQREVFIEVWQYNGNDIDCLDISP